jgi:hypothetical protein
MFVYYISEKIYKTENPVKRLTGFPFQKQFINFIWYSFLR